MSESVSVENRPGETGGLLGLARQIPLWIYLLGAIILGVLIYVVRSENARDIVEFLARGLTLTLMITLAGYALALVIGLIAGLGRVSSNPVIYAIATLYVEFMRGVPILVTIIWVAFVIGPLIGLRDNMWRAIVALALCYGAYLAEVFRAGIQAISKGQIEAARALGLSGLQTQRFVVLPQAIRIILPPLGNDFIAFLKDSSLASVISVPEMTQQTRLYVSRTFDTFGGYTMLALLYLSMTIALSMVVRLLERYSRVRER